MHLRSSDRSHLDAAVAEVFETMAFAVVEPDEDADLDWDRGDLAWAQMAIYSPPLGLMTLAVPPELAAELLETIGGGFDECPKSAVTDLLAELANTLAGAWAAHVCPEHGELRVGLPVSADGPPPRSDSPQVCAVYTVDESRFGVMVAECSEPPPE